MPRHKAVPKRAILSAAESVAAAASPLEPCPVTSFPVLSAVLAGSADADDSGDSPTVPTNGERKSSAPKRKPASRRKSSPRKNCVTPSRNEFDYCCEVACLLVSWVGDGSWSETSKCIITALHEGGRVIMASAADDAEACACIVGSGVTERVLNSLRSLQQHGVLAVRAVNLDNNKVKFELGIAPGFVAEGRRGARRIADSLTSARRRELGTVLDWAAATRREPPVGTDLEVGTEEFLAAVKPPGECPLDEAVPLSGEDRLACTLLDFQRHTVAWMHQAEARPSDQRVPHPSWFPLDDVFINPRLPGVSRSAVSLRLASVRGGMLCDEMGLGKTVEVLALVTTRPYPSDGRSPAEVLNDFYASQQGALRELEDSDDLNDSHDARSRKLRREVADLHATYLLQDGYAKSAAAPQGKQERSVSWLDEYHPEKARAFREAFGYPEISDVAEVPIEGSWCLTCDEAGAAGASWVACDVCDGWHHQQCVGYTPSVEGQPFVCLSCLHRARVKLLPVAATLVVVPASLLQQWVREIGRHAPAMRLVVYAENEQGVHPSLPDLVSADVVLVSYTVLGASLLRTESAEWDSRHALRYRRQSSSTRLPSALLRVRWWRLIMDEAQMTEGGHSGACRMLRRLVATNRWAVTGTPMTRGDLRPVLEFLRVPLDGTDVKAIQDSQGGALRLLPLMKCLLWRVWKVDVLDQLKMHGLVQHVVWQELSAVEMFGYRRLEESIRKEAQGSLARRGASRNAVTYLWDLTRLLQLQCVHQDLRMKQKTSYTGRKAKSFTDVKYSTFEQNVKALMAGATNRAEEALRNLVATWNGQAGLLKLKGDDEAARSLYSKALEAEKKYGTRVDKVQKIHALVHSEASPPEVEGETERFLAATSVPIRAHSANYYKLREQLPSDSSQWWLVAAPTLQGPMAAAYFQQDLREIDGHVGKIVEALESIPLDSPPEHLVTESICCEKCRGKGRPGRSCFFCRLNPHFEGYQRVARLPRFKKIGYEAASGSDLFKYFRVIQGIMACLRSWCEACRYRFGCYDELRQARLAYRWPSDGDVRPQNGQIESWDLDQALIVWGPEELELKLVELQAEENDAEVKLRRNLGHLRFLKTQLPTESEDRPGLELCPVCATEKPTTVCMLPCGHSYCQQCITTLLQRGRGSLRCPECRVFTRRNEIGHIAGEPPEPEEANSSPAPSESLCEGSVLNEIFTPIPEVALRAMDATQQLVGQWGTRISSVTLLLKHITEALGESVCVFSKWVPVLHLLGSALKTNKVPFVFWSVGRLKMVERFFDGRVRVLLCPLASAGQGLNLTVASHAILLEPPAKYSQTAQAAARIWRLGQEKEATVWHFVSCRTVEEAMWTLSRRTDEEEDAELLRDIFSGLTGERVS